MIVIHRQHIEMLQGWFLQHVRDWDGKPFKLDTEQAAIVIHNNKNTIVTARAGAGKTRTLLAKLVWLNQRGRIPFDELIVLTFNTSVRDEINKKLAAITVNGQKILPPDQKVAINFHSFANQISPRIESSPLNGSSRSNFIEQLLTVYGDKKKIYHFLRDSREKDINDTPSNLSEYYATLRQLHYTTLRGEGVKSRYEKIIADYLFEHGIDYEYERPIYTKKLPVTEEYQAKMEEHMDTVKPDFYLPKYQLFWEHWAIRGDEDEAEIQDFNNSPDIGEYEDYKKNYDWKHWFYAREWVDEMMPVENPEAQVFLESKGLIETHASFPQSREEFEQYITDILLEHGVTEALLPEDERYRRAWEQKTTRKRTTGLTEQFINRAEQQYFDDYEALKSEIGGLKDERIRSFNEIANDTLEKYLEILPLAQKPKDFEKFNHHLDDFNLSLVRARNALRMAADDGDFEIKVDALKYILIDEYQDFSELFHQVVDATRRHCPGAKMLCVGDDWQAINGYMGADLKFFHDFEQYYPEDCSRFRITTNYRSGDDIVQNANTFMEKALDDHAGCVGTGKSSRIRKLDIKKQWLEYRADWQGREADDIYKKAFRFPDASRYAKSIVEIIERNPSWTFLILSRKNQPRFFGEAKLTECNSPLKELKSIIKQIVVQKGIMTGDEYEKQVNFRTINTAKGLEADVAIVLETQPGIFPLEHPDTELYEVFGATRENELAEQKRLFYVAITRGAQELYLLYGSDKTEDPEPNNFLKYLDDELCRPWYNTLQAMHYVEKTEKQQRQVNISNIQIPAKGAPYKITTNEIDPVVVLEKSSRSARYNVLLNWLVRKLTRKPAGERDCILYCDWRDGVGIWRVKFGETFRQTI